MLRCSSIRRVTRFIVVMTICVVADLRAFSQQKMYADEACMKREFTHLYEENSPDSANIERITEAEYDALFAQQKQVQIALPEKVIISDSLISFTAGGKNFNYKISSSEWYGYGCYLSLLGLHYIIHSSASAGTVSNWFVNDQSGEVYHLSCPIDDGFALVSPIYAGNSIVLYGNSTMSDLSIVTVYQIDCDGRTYCLKKSTTNVFYNSRIMEIYDTGEGMAIIHLENYSDQINYQTDQLPNLEYFKIIWQSPNSSGQKKQ